jgi:predicted MPP superfamily phosphohydrolase
MQSLNQGDSPLKVWPLLGIGLMQTFLLLAHWFIFRTLIVFDGNFTPDQTLALGISLFVLAFSFIAAALLGYYFSSLPVRLIYKIAAVWLGFLNYFFFAACLCRLTSVAFLLTPLAPQLPQYRPLIAGILFALAFLTGIYGLLNARWVRIRRVTIQLPNLPAAWRGRTALLLSDLHLGNVNGLGFSRRMVALAARLQPDIVFLPGDLFDGVHADPARLIAPFKNLSPPLGIYFTAGNHEEYGGEANFTHALTQAGIRVLANEKVTVDGLQILGIPYADSHYPIQLRATLEALRPDPAQPSILLNHAPHRLAQVEQAGVSLQLSGHTHGGQLIPFTWFTRYAFGEFTYGLQRFGSLQVYTSSGAGTWGPPMRVGTHPEVVLLQFE